MGFRIFLFSLATLFTSFYFLGYLFVFTWSPDQTADYKSRYHPRDILAGLREPAERISIVLAFIRTTTCSYWFFVSINASFFFRRAFFKASQRTDWLEIYEINNLSEKCKSIAPIVFMEITASYWLTLVAKVLSHSFRIFNRVLEIYLWLLSVQEILYRICIYFPWFNWR